MHEVLVNRLGGLGLPRKSVVRLTDRRDMTLDFYRGRKITIEQQSLYTACNDRNAFFTSDAVRNYNLWSRKRVCEALTFLLDKIYIGSGSKLYRQMVGIPKGTKCAPLLADLFLFCYERLHAVSFRF